MVEIQTYLHIQWSTKVKILPMVNGDQLAILDLEILVIKQSLRWLGLMNDYMRENNIAAVPASPGPRRAPRP